MSQRNRRRDTANSPSAGCGRRGDQCRIVEAAAPSEHQTQHVGGDAVIVLRPEGPQDRPGVTNVRNTKSPYWRRWLGFESRCVLPFTSFAEHEVLADCTRPPIWFALNDERPLACFASIWINWTSVRKVKEGETTNDVFAFIATAPSEPVWTYRPKAMPVVLTTQAEID